MKLYCGQSRGVDFFGRKLVLTVVGTYNENYFRVYIIGVI